MKFHLLRNGLLGTVMIALTAAVTSCRPAISQTSTPAVGEWYAEMRVVPPPGSPDPVELNPLRFVTRPATQAECEATLASAAAELQAFIADEKEHHGSQTDVTFSCKQGSQPI